MFDFSLSTQYRQWLYDSPETLAKMREMANEDAKKALMAGDEAPLPRSFAVTMGRQLPEDDRNNGAAENGAVAGVKRPRAEAPTVKEGDLPSVEEELSLLRYCMYLLQDSCGPRSESVRRGVQVQATALTFLKRFFLSNSMIDFDPKIVLQACLFLAAKVECEYLKLAELKEVFDEKYGKASQVIDFEAKLLQGLGFCLKTYHPYNPLLGLVHGFELFARQAKLGLKGDDVERLANHATELLDLLMVTDVPLLHLPARVALAALLHSAEALGLKAQVDRYLEERFGDEDEFDEGLEEARGMLPAIQREKEGPASLDERKDEQGAACKPVMSKLRKCARWSSKSKKKSKAASQSQESAVGEDG